jgi:hypothetical protein
VGFIPNMYAGMANSPGLLETYMDGYDRFRKDSGLTPAELSVEMGRDLPATTTTTPAHPSSRSALLDAGRIDE